MTKKRIVNKGVISKKEKRLKKVLTACDKSIEHWEEDMLKMGLIPMGEDCALCVLNRNDDCVGCIVYEITGDDCRNTGFDTYVDIQGLLDRGDAPSRVINKLVAMKYIAAKVEINFLKALKALTVERLKNERLKDKIKLLLPKKGEL